MQQIASVEELARQKVRGTNTLGMGIQEALRLEAIGFCVALSHVRRLVDYMSYKIRRYVDDVKQYTICIVHFYTTIIATRANITRRHACLCGVNHLTPAAFFA